MKLHACSLCVTLLLSLYIPHGLSGNYPNGSSKKHDDSSIAGSSLRETPMPSSSSCHDTHEVEVAFSSSIVENEYIVKFIGYYRTRARENYIGTVLNSSNVKNWKIIPRNNAASMYPSDFDVVHLKETDKDEGLRALSNHPLVKTVSPQRLIHRTLKFVNRTSSDSNVLTQRNPKRRISHHVSLQIVKLLKCHVKIAVNFDIKRCTTVEKFRSSCTVKEKNLNTYVQRNCL